MKPILYLRLLPWFLCLLSFGALRAQPALNAVAQEVQIAHATDKKFVPLRPFKRVLLPLGDERKALQRELKQYTILDYTAPAFDAASAPDAIQLSIPRGDGPAIQLDLVKATVLTTDFTLVTSAGDSPRFERAIHYRGVDPENPNSIAAISFLPGEMMGVINVDDHTLVLGKIMTAKDQKHVFYRAADLVESFTGSCDTEAKPFSKDQQPLLESMAKGEALGLEKSGGCVQVYLELEHDLVTEKGGAAGATNFITGLWNVVATLYQNENIATQISQIFAWTTPDSYPTTGGTTAALYSFRSARPSFNGDLAHLISRGAPANGGVAFLDGLCNPNAAYAYSYIYSGYAAVPTYSWSVNVLAHEMGHNLGSRHTHACVWNGNNTAIDGCGPAVGANEGCNAPLPTNGGTIMSYCHLVSSVGINFINGFGNQPGNLIRANVAAASCLSGCSNGGCPVLTYQITGVSCNGAADGGLTVSPQGGTPPYTYLWSTGATTASISNLTAGTYTVTVTDGGNCSEVGAAVVSEPAPINAPAGMLQASP
ncbi:MAG: M12 family metallo-peptidase [Bacteroidota bacterium]